MVTGASHFGNLLSRSALVVVYLPSVLPGGGLRDSGGDSWRNPTFPESREMRATHRMLQHIVLEPYRTMVITALCLGIRRSELIALKWSDFDWATSTVMIQRSMVDTRTGEVKTEYSERPLPLDPALVGLLRRWQQQTEFKAQSDWVWASPFQAGTLPYYPNWIQREYITKAGLRVGLGSNVGWHTLRHTYRAWLDKAGAPLGVQKDLTRHANIGTTMNVYGGALPEEQQRANSAVVGMAIQ